MAIDTERIFLLATKKSQRVENLTLSGLGQIELAAHREKLVIRGEKGMPALIGDHCFLSFPAPSRVKRESAAGSVSLWHYPNR